VRLRFFVTHWEPAKIDDFMAGFNGVVDELGIPQPMPPVSLIGVDYLFEPDVLVEVEAFAVLD
jgi:enamine deaminase RidA (YjgF/YER057c/UK114 family)